jgi:hypothetical protein
MKIYLGLALAALAAAAPVCADSTIEQVCGPPGNIVKNTIYTEKCYAAYLAGNNSLIFFVLATTVV